MVEAVAVVEALDVERELYAGVTIDRARGRPVAMAAAEGGVDIEELARVSPEKVAVEPIDPDAGLMPFRARKIARRLGLAGAVERQTADVIRGLADVFLATDASLVEVNPLVVTPTEKVVAADARITLDDNALFRHPELEKLRDPGQEDPRDVEAARAGLSYVGLEGDIGCLVNGAGLAMAILDILKLHGGSPANFLDVGGAATPERVAAAFEIIERDPRVKAVLVVIFGGIVRCDVVADGVISAARGMETSCPLVVRMEGTAVDEGRKLFDASGLEIETAPSLDEAARRAVELAGAR
jgi:succinyl-CoA synthetase beta subunit